jgi:hypothetical protein
MGPKLITVGIVDSCFVKQEFDVYSSFGKFLESNLSKLLSLLLLKGGETCTILKNFTNYIYLDYKIFGAYKITIIYFGPI